MSLCNIHQMSRDPIIYPSATTSAAATATRWFSPHHRSRNIVRAEQIPLLHLFVDCRNKAGSESKPQGSTSNFINLIVVCVKLWSMFLLQVGALIILMFRYAARWWCEITDIDRSMIRISKSTSCLICYASHYCQITNRCF